MLYTSYFAIGRRIPPEIKRISIAAHPPKGWDGLKYPLLTPNFDLNRSLRIGLPGDKRCDNEYRQYVLRHADPARVADELSAIAGDRDVVLMTMEGVGKYSCRETLRAWFNENGVPCEEWVDPVIEQRRVEREAAAARKMELAAAAQAQLTFL